jgi:hypothetical protein
VLRRGRSLREAGCITRESWGASVSGLKLKYVEGWDGAI